MSNPERSPGGVGPTRGLKGEKRGELVFPEPVVTGAVEKATLLEGPLQKHWCWEEVGHIDPDLSTPHPLNLSQYLTGPPRAGQGRVDSSGVRVATANEESQDHLMC